jgi:hypothetical protein
MTKRISEANSKALKEAQDYWTAVRRDEAKPIPIAVADERNVISPNKKETEDGQ